GSKRLYYDSKNSDLIWFIFLLKLGGYYLKSWEYPGFFSR
ncbi:MAG: hypothetical protein ACJA0G_002551, partial [Kangiellaceae bacterium]